METRPEPSKSRKLWSNPKKSKLSQVSPPPQGVKAIVFLDSVSAEQSSPGREADAVGGMSKSYSPGHQNAEFHCLPMERTQGRWESRSGSQAQKSNPEMDAQPIFLQPWGSLLHLPNLAGWVPDIDRWSLSFWKCSTWVRYGNWQVMD